MTKIAIQFLFIFVVGITSRMSHPSYDAFPPNTGPYVSGPASVELSWGGEDFELYNNGTTIECSSIFNQVLTAPDRCLIEDCRSTHC